MGTIGFVAAEGDELRITVRDVGKQATFDSNVWLHRLIDGRSVQLYSVDTPYPPDVENVIALRDRPRSSARRARRGRLLSVARHRGPDLRGRLERPSATAAGATSPAPATSIAGKGQCRCLPPKVECGGECVDVFRDANNCSACGLVCAKGGFCTEGKCACPAEQEECAGACVNVLEDPEHCGTCGTVCAKGGFCTEGKCACPAEQEECAGACVNVLEDPEHCGTCGTVCAKGGFCTEGKCACPAEQEECAGACVNVLEDPEHCGTCGTVCASDRHCLEGRCACLPQLKTCAEECVNVSTNPEHCGECDVVCVSPAVNCIEGVCTE